MSRAQSVAAVWSASTPARGLSLSKEAVESCLRFLWPGDEIPIHRPDGSVEHWKVLSVSEDKVSLIVIGEVP